MGTANQSKQEGLSDMEYTDHRRDLPVVAASIVLLVLCYVHTQRYKHREHSRCASTVYPACVSLTVY